MQALETEYSPVLTALEKMASVYIKVVNVQNPAENAQQNAAGKVPQKKVLAPIYDGSDLELIDDDWKDEEGNKRTPSLQNPGRNLRQTMSVGSTNQDSETASHTPLCKTVTISEPEQVTILQNK